MRNSETLERCVGGCRVSSGLGSYPGTEGAGLALLASLALGGRLLGTHMSQWHHLRSGWGRGRDFSGRSSAKKRGGNHIPERWKDYLPVGQRMPGTRFIAFKVPLQKSFEKKLAPEECFSPLDLFNKIREQNEELGLIIDLTYTQRYYKPEDLPESVPYLKIFTVGHQVPDDETIFKFKHAVNGYSNLYFLFIDKLIGVHCTHGLNRTGYLICRPFYSCFLFNRCRGHCLERQNYIEDLQNGPIRKNWNSSVSRSSFEDSAHLMQPVHTMNKPVKRGPRYNLHQIQGHSTPRHFHTQTQNLQQSVRKFSQNPHVYQRGHLPPPGPPGEDCSRRRYSWNVKPNASLAAQDRRRWYPDNYSGLSYPAYWEWTQ
uniref:RNA/RNP complex-1-interacting phosphatase n=1 Tax=Rhinopithecus bieti TaxID=61621 RepID=A0A2K6LXC5_RHIBE